MGAEGAEPVFVFRSLRDFAALGVLSVVGYPRVCAMEGQFMRNVLCLLIGSVLSFSSVTAMAVENQLADSPCDRVVGRPCVALVLGGGGARGGAHVGVLKQLEAQQIPVDIIVGTSIGAFVGGLYAQGHSPEEIEQLLGELPWGKGFRDRVDRDELPVRRKQQRDEFPINFDLGVGADGVKLPKGVLHGQAMAALIQEAYGLSPELASFDQLAIPFRAVATDLTDRSEVVLADGSLTQAVQASMSIPGVLRPMTVRGKMLVDGGVANNLPISVAKALGADQIIAVAIDSPLLAPQELDSAMAITEQLTNFLVQEAVNRQLKLLGPNDLLLKPDLKTIGTLDFEKIRHAMAGGKALAYTYQQRLARYSQPEHYAKWQNAHRAASTATVTLSAIELSNETNLADPVLTDRLDIAIDRPITEAELRQGIRRIYGLDVLERVTASLQNEPDGTQRLKLQAIEKSWGPAYLNFRVALEDDFQNTHNYAIAASYLLTGLSKAGAELQTDLQLGTNKELRSEFFWPFGHSDFFASSSVTQQRTVLGLENSQGLTQGDLTNRELQLHAELGWLPADQSSISFGVVKRDGQFVLPASLAQELNYAKLNYLREGSALNASFDSLDSRSFPSRGLRFEASWQSLRDRVGGLNSDSDSISIDGQFARQWRQHIFRGRLRYESVEKLEGQQVLEQFSLGGLHNLSGYPANYLFGSKVKFGSLVYLYQFADEKFSVFNAPFYVGASLERGQVLDSRFGSNVLPLREDWIWAGSVFAGWDSPFGPLYLGYGQAEADFQDKPYRFYLSLGQLF